MSERMTIDDVRDHYAGEENADAARVRVHALKHASTIPVNTIPVLNLQPISK